MSLYTHKSLTRMSFLNRRLAAGKLLTMNRKTSTIRKSRSGPRLIALVTLLVAATAASLAPQASAKAATTWYSRGTVCFYLNSDASGGGFAAYGPNCQQPLIPGETDATAILASTRYWTGTSSWTRYRYSNCIQIEGGNCISHTEGSYVNHALGASEDWATWRMSDGLSVYCVYLRLDVQPSGKRWGRAWAQPVAYWQGC